MANWIDQTGRPALLGAIGGLLLALIVQRTWTLLKSISKRTAKKFNLSNREASMLYLCIIIGAVLGVVYGSP